MKNKRHNIEIGRGLHRCTTNYPKQINRKQKTKAVSCFSK